MTILMIMVADSRLVVLALSLEAQRFTNYYLPYIGGYMTFYRISKSVLQ